VEELPVVIVEMWEGRTDEQKEKLIKGESLRLLRR